jgi:predicted nucleic acid-binding protein
MASPADALVVDASVAVKWHLKDEEYAAESTLLLTRFAQGQVELFAPSHLNYEVASAISVATLRQPPRLSQTEGREALEELVSLGLRTVDDPTLTLEAYDLVHQHGIALYDALYLALSLRLQIPLLNADSKLQQRVGHLANVVWIGDYQEPEP